MNLCDDNRIITIEKAKQALIKGTNIEDSPEEMKVLDNILFRCWQMGWLERYAPPRHFNAMPKVISERLAAGHGSNVQMQPNIPPMPTNTSNALKTLDSVNATQSNALGEQTKWNRMMLHLADLQLTYSPNWGANGQGDQKLYDFVTELIDEFSGWDVTDTNVGEMITKRQMIDVLERVKRTANDILYDGPVLMSYNDVLDSLINIVNFLPPAQPEKRTEERTETYACDSISRQAAIDAVQNRPMMLSKEKVLLINDLEKLPSAEPKRGKWIYREKRKFIDLANADLQYRVLGYPHRPYRNMECSLCHRITIADETILYKFCPHCGADMREVTE